MVYRPRERSRRRSCLRTQSRSLRSSMSRAVLHRADWYHPSQPPPAVLDRHDASLEKLARRLSAQASDAGLKRYQGELIASPATFLFNRCSRRHCLAEQPQLVERERQAGIVVERCRAKAPSSFRESDREPVLRWRSWATAAANDRLSVSAARLPVRCLELRKLSSISTRC